MNPYLLINLKQKYLPSVPKDDYDSVSNLMKKLSRRSQIICALEAVKMILPIWEDYVSKCKQKFTKQIKETPKKTIAAVEKWLAGKATIKKIREAIQPYKNYIQTTGLIFSFAAEAVSFTVDFISSSGSASAVITSAADAVLYDDITNINNKITVFYEKWWDKCYPSIQKELQSKCDKLYGKLCTQIVEDI